MAEGDIRAADAAAKNDAKNKEAQKNAAAQETLKLDFNFGRSGGTSPGGTLYYPKELESSSGTTDYVRFSFFEYNPPYGSNSTSVGTRGSIERYDASVSENLTPAKDADGNELPKVILYMPEDISADYGADWNGKSIQNATGSALAAAAAGLEGKPIDFLKKLGEGLQNLGEGTLPFIVGEATKKLQEAGQAEGLTINDIFSATTNIVLNPNTELLFTGFNLRTFPLSFKLAPRNDGESKSIRDIITTFKMAMLPSLKDLDGGGSENDRGSFIKIPNLVQVEFMTGASPNPWLTQFKPCAITALNVRYTPDGTYSTYAGGAPVAVSLSLNFTETKLVYKENIKWGGPSF